MNCNDTRLLLEAYSDGELDLVRQLELEAHLRACPACALRAKGLATRREVLRDSVPRFAAPPQFREKIQALVRAEAAPATAAGARRPAISWPSFWNFGGAAASLAFVLFIGYTWGNTRARTNAWLDEAVSDHVRSLQAGHLMDVASTDRHTVKPWFAGKLDFSPPVFDLADAGFPLAGGRLERIDGTAAAALVFHRRLHAINLFVWPAADGSVPTHRGAENGFNAESWSQGGLNFLAVSEIPATELDQFAAEYRNRAN